MASVYNKNHAIMQNGTGLRGDASSTHSAIVVPKPDSLNEYYIFTVDIVSSFSNGLQYSVVDMSLDGGLGGVTTKNIMLFDEVSEKVVAYKKTASNGFWVVGHKYNSNEFIAYEVSAAGVNPTPVISSVGIFYGPIYRMSGQIKISLDGKRLAVATGEEVQVFDFDESTGRVSNAITLFPNIRTSTYGVEFSPNNRLLYTTGYGFVAQYDLTAGSEMAIENSKTVLITGRSESFGSLQLGPDEKIYGVKVREYHLDVIHDPNNLGTSCNYRYNDLDLNGRQGFLGLPTFISNIYYIKGNIVYENTCLGDNTAFSIETEEVLTSVLWDFGDGTTSTLETPAHTYAASGTYTVNVTVNTATATKTETETITIYEVPAANSVTDFEVCSSAPTYALDLSTKDNEVLGTQSSTDYTITYHPTVTDAQNGTNALPIPYTNTNTTETITARISNVNNSACFDTVSFDVVVKEAPELYTVTDWVVCDTDTDGRYDFDLAQKDTEVLNGQSPTTFSVWYYSSQTDADTASNPMGPDYTNVASPQPIFYRIASTAYPECYETGSFNIEVVTAVTAHKPMDMEVCDDDNDGFFSFDLTTKNTEILGTQSATHYAVSYHTTQLDADANQNALNATGYTNTSAYNQTLYVRVETVGNTSCYNTTSFELLVYDAPIVQTVNDWQVCDDDNDGYQVFDLHEKDAEVLGGQSAADFTVRYYESQADADSGQNEVLGPLGNTVNPQTIYYSVENNRNPNCYITDSFVLEIFDTPVAHAPSTWVVCDVNETGTLTFDLSGKNDEVLNGQDVDRYTVAYFATQEEAENNQNPLSKNSYTNSAVQELIYIRIHNNKLESCYDTASFELVVNPVPEPILEETYVICPDSPQLTIDGGDFESWSWRDGNGIEIGSERTIDIRALGDHSLTVSEIRNGITCDKTVTFEVVSSGAPENLNTEVNGFGDKITLELTTSGIGEFEYSIDGENYQGDNRFEVFPGEYTVYVRDTFLCRTLTENIIALGYQRFFTPNGDGSNERWHIIGADKYPESRLQIYDRYGKLLAQITPTDPGWNGTYNGSRLPSADYWFKYTFDGGKSMTGHFSLKR